MSPPPDRHPPWGVYSLVEALNVVIVRSLVPASMGMVSLGRLSMQWGSQTLGGLVKGLLHKLQPWGALQASIGSCTASKPTENRTLAASAES